MRTKDFIYKQSKLLGDTTAKSCHTASVCFSNGIIYSYGTHYPLLFKVGSKVFRNIRGYSATTGKHISYAGYCSDYDVIIPNTQYYGMSNNLDKKSIKEYLRAEKKEIKKEIKELSSRAWKQKEIKEKRLAEIEEAIKAIK